MDTNPNPNDQNTGTAPGTDTNAATGDKSNPHTIESLTALVNEHKEDLYVFEKKLNDQEVLINHLKGNLLQTKVEQKGPKQLTLPTKLAKVDGKEYKFNLAAFNLNGEIISAEDALLDEGILKRIIAIPGQGIMTEQH